MTLTHDQRVLHGRLGAHRVHAAGKTNTAPARRAFNARFEREVDPQGKLSPIDRAKRAEHARKAYFIALAARSAAARKRRAS